MAISFPGSPSTGQKFTSGNKVWTWDGNSWKGGVSSGGDAGTLDSLNSTQFLRSDATGGTTGSLGVGTTSPVAGLDVLGTSGYTGTVHNHAYASGEGARIFGNEAVLDILGQDTGDHSSSVYFRNGTEGFAWINDPDSNSFQLRSFTSTGNDFSAHGTGAAVSNLVSILDIDKTGNVGIGVTSPNNKLEVDGTIAFSKNGTSGNRWLLIEGADGTYAGTMNIQAGFGSNAAGGAIKLYAHQHATYPGSTWIGRSAGAAGNIMFGNGGTGPASANSIQMVINSSGNVGIGTASPSYKLDVKVGSGSGGAGRIQQQAVTNSVASSNGVFVVEGTESQIQVIAEDSGSWASNITLSNVPSSGNNKHWTIHHTPASHPSAPNSLQFNYVATSTASNIGGDGTGAASEHKMTIASDGTVTATSFEGDGSSLTGVVPLTVGTTAPSSPSIGDQWFDSTTGISAMKVWSGSEWDTMSSSFQASGGTVTTYYDGGLQYKAHTFTSSGTFTSQSTGSVDVMIVAGGGGAGLGHGTNALGGGGAGGMRVSTGVAVLPNAYSIIIGAGGPRGTVNGVDPTSNGVSSSALGLSTVGGGRGDGDGEPGTVSNSNGGSGGGGSTYRMSTGSTLVNAGGSGTSGQGNAGAGSILTGAVGSSGGGGGAGAAGQNSSTTGNGGNGGVGLQNNYRTGSNIYYAGGGGGAGWEAQTAGLGGLGGGGDAPIRGSGTNANADVNTGGGGGASKGNATDTPGNGGSGIVIIRYTI
jgi:hypothetical protein